MTLIPASIGWRGGWLIPLLCIGAAAVGFMLIQAWLGNRSAERAATANAAAVSADETVQAAADVQRVVIDVNSTERAIDARTMENRNAIFRAEGAGLDMPAAVAGAGRHALCLRPTYRADPACQQLRDADPD